MTLTGDGVSVFVRRNSVPVTTIMSSEAGEVVLTVAGAVAEGVTAGAAVVGSGPVCAQADVAATSAVPMIDEVRSFIRNARMFARPFQSRSGRCAFISP